jgi:hypothetical protein
MSHGYLTLRVTPFCARSLIMIVGEKYSQVIREVSLEKAGSIEQMAAPTNRCRDSMRGVASPPTPSNQDLWDGIVADYDEFRLRPSKGDWAPVQQIARWFATSKWAAELTPLTSMMRLCISRAREHSNWDKLKSIVAEPGPDGRLKLTLFGPRGPNFSRDEIRIEIVSESDAPRVADEMAKEL